MIYRIEKFVDNRINPITKCEYDKTWMILILTDSSDYEKMCGSHNECSYIVKISRINCKNWAMSIGDFISFCESNEKNALLVMSDTELNIVKEIYKGHTYHEQLLRDDEPTILVHSTPMQNWELIKRDGRLKSWNRLKKENAIDEEHPIGIRLGDPTDFSDYIMFGSGVTGEIVVNSKQLGIIEMNIDTKYRTGARLYFDAKKMAQDGLLVRDGCHLKVKDVLPLDPYLIWTATWKNIGLDSPISTPKVFSEKCDCYFMNKFSLK
jgi:hypothetical protein